MSVHPDGSGSGWTNVETVDVNQPHGFDYRYSQHIAKGVRKRLDQEHSTFADATVGAIHTPGGCAILGMEISDDGGDITSPVVGDGTYRARGLVWAWDGSQNAILWCATKAAGNSTTGDWTVLMIHPDKQWGGRDVTWAGAHEFDASVDISGNVAMDGDLTVDGVLKVDSSADFSDVYVDGDISVKGSLKVATDVTITGDMAIDGTSNFYDEVDFSDVYLRGDVTGSALGIVSVFGAYTDEDDDSQTLAAAHAYLANQDGFVLAVWTATGAGNAVNAYIDTDNNPAAGGDLVQKVNSYGNGYEYSISFPVAKGKYWEITHNGTSVVIRWFPIGVLVKCTDQD